MLVSVGAEDDLPTQLHREAQRLFGGGNVVHDWEPWMNARSGMPGYAVANTNAGVDPNTVVPGLSLRTAAAASAVGQAHGGNSVQIIGPGSGKAFMAMRFRLAGSNWGAQNRVFCGLMNMANNASMGIGFLGPLDTANVVLQYDGIFTGASSFLPLFTKAAATTSKTIRMWWPADGKLHVSVDGVEVGTGVTLASPIVNMCKLWYEIQNGTDTDAREAIQAWRFMAHPET